MKWKRTQAAGEFAREVLGTDPETGEKLSTQEVIERLSKHAEKHPQFMIEFLRHDLGKPIERVQVETTVYILTCKDKKELPEGDQLDGFILKGPDIEREDQNSLPEGGKM